MCKILDQALPVIGAVVGTVIGGPVGGAIGGGLGGFAGSYAQNHDFGGSLLNGGISAGATYLGGELGQGLGAAGAESAPGAGAFTTGLEGGADTLGGLESSLGGASMFGVGAGTGTAIGADTAGAIGAGNLGIAGGAGSLGDVLGGSSQYAAGLGGGQQGTGIDSSGAIQPTQGLGGGQMTGEGPQATPQPSMSAGTNPGQLSQTGVAPQQQFSVEGTQGAPDQSGLSTLYGPDSTAQQSPMGNAISHSTPDQGVSFNGSNLGQPSMDYSGGGGDFSWNSPQGLNTLMRLGNTGLGAYQQYMQQQKANQYAHSIDQMYAPNSPYAQQMQQELARKDAAAGRNSQYGSRAVQLAAALTQGKAQALSGNNYANAAQNNSGASMLNGLFANFGSPQGMQSLYGAGQSAYNGLSNLFSGGF